MIAVGRRDGHHCRLHRRCGGNGEVVQVVQVVHERLIIAQPASDVRFARFRSRFHLQFYPILRGENRYREPCILVLKIKSESNPLEMRSLC